MSAHFNLVKGHYDAGRWGIDRVQKAVEKNWITADEYKEITGMDYV